MSQPNQNGRYYFCIKVPKTLAKDGEVYAWADKVETKDGALVLRGAFYSGDLDDHGHLHIDYDNPTKEGFVNLVFAPGAWLVCYAASTMDGAPVNVEHWKEEWIGDQNG